MLHTKFQDIESKMDSHLYKIWSTMYVPMLHTKFQLNPTNSSGEEVKK